MNKYLDIATLNFDSLNKNNKPQYVEQMPRHETYLYKRLLGNWEGENENWSLVYEYY
jgi:hypothetical protein